MEREIISQVGAWTVDCALEKLTCAKCSLRCWLGAGRGKRIYDCKRVSKAKLESLLNTYQEAFEKMMETPLEA